MRIKFSSHNKDVYIWDVVTRQQKVQHMMLQEEQSEDLLTVADGDDSLQTVKFTILHCQQNDQ